MKVEIGESLVLSWLRHVHGCVLAQLNWKPSPAWEVAGENQLAQDFDAIRDYVDQGSGIRIFKRPSFGSLSAKRRSTPSGCASVPMALHPSSSALTPRFMRTAFNTAITRRPSLGC